MTNQNNNKYSDEILRKADIGVHFCKWASKFDGTMPLGKLAETYREEVNDELTVDQLVLGYTKFLFLSIMK